MSFIAELLSAYPTMPKLDADIVKKSANGTGYFNGLVKIKITEVVSFVDEYGRNGIVIPLKDGTGNIALFERYAGSPVIVANQPECLHLMFYTALNELEKQIIRKFLQGDPVAATYLDEYFIYNWPGAGEYMQEDIANTKKFLQNNGMMLHNDVMVEA